MQSYFSDRAKLSSVNWHQITEDIKVEGHIPELWTMVPRSTTHPLTPRL